MQIIDISHSYGEMHWGSVIPPELVSEVHNLGGELMAVGGVVRDMLLKQPPSDIDLVCNLCPDQLLKIAKKLHISVLTHGIGHGTVTFLMKKGEYCENLEITSVRTDISTDGRHAEVVFGNDWEADANRRDFTINAIYRDSGGIIYDFVGGVNDLRRGENVPLIRFIGNPHIRIKEDYLRILRFFRFCATYGVASCDVKSEKACSFHVDKLCTLPVERKTEELFKILDKGWIISARDIFLKMQNCGLLEHFDLKYDYRMHELNLCPGSLYGSNKYALLLLMFPSRSDTFIASWCKKWKVSNSCMHFLQAAALVADIFINSDLQIKECALIEPLQDMVDYIAIMHGKKMPSDDETFLECIRTGLYLWLYYVNKNVCKLENERTFFDSCHFIKRNSFCIDGKDIITFFNIKQGKNVGEYMDMAKQYWGNNFPRPTREQIFAYLKSCYDLHDA